MWEFFQNLPFSIEVWKAVAMMFGVAIFFLVGVYNKYWVLREKIDKQVGDLESSVKVVLESSKETNVHLDEIKVQHETMFNNIDKIMHFIVMAEQFKEKQKEQIDLLNKILANFEESDVCKLKDELKNMSLDSEHNKDLKKFIEMLCEQYDFHKKD